MKSEQKVACDLEDWSNQGKKLFVISPKMESELHPGLTISIKADPWIMHLKLTLFFLFQTK